MALPALIEIAPVVSAVSTAVSVPGSKSATNRLLLLAALAPGTTRLEGALWSDDTQVMVECLRSLGFPVHATPDPFDRSSVELTVEGGLKRLLDGGTREKPLELFVGNAGTAARFLAAFVCLGRGAYRLHGVPRMHQRPQKALFQALRQLGYMVEAADDRLPATIFGTRARIGRCQVSIQESSQFASALLLCSQAGGWQVEITGENEDESPYVRMTQHLVSTFPEHGGTIRVEPDASTASYFWAAEHLLNGSPDPWTGRTRPGRAADPSVVQIRNWAETPWQIDACFRQYTKRAGAQGRPLPHHRTISRASDLGDSIMTAVICAPLWEAPTRFTDLGRLRLQECERVQALRTELSNCGARVDELGDTLVVHPSELHGAEVETYEDHRMAMCFATLGLVVPGMRLRNPACVKKTFPDFFTRLAAPPPTGLGVSIVDVGTGTALHPSELYAE